MILGILGCALSVPLKALDHVYSKGLAKEVVEEKREDYGQVQAELINPRAVHSRRASAHERPHARIRTFARAFGSTRARFAARARAPYSFCVRVVAETLVLFVVVFA